MDAKTGKLVLGTVQFGLKYGINNSSGKPDLKTVFEILDAAFRNNIALLDTAEAYGESHAAIGAYHSQSANRFRIITKYKASPDDPGAGLRSRVAADLRELHVDRLEAYMFHSYSDFERYFAPFRDEVGELKSEGLIRKFGVSVYTNRELEQLLNCPEVDMVQLPFNMLDNKAQRGDLLKKAHDRGIEIHTRSVFLQGLFFLNPERLPEKLLPLKPYLEQLNSISRSTALKLNALSLNYALQQEHVDRVLIGVDAVHQLNENLHAIDANLDAELLHRIDSIFVKETELLNPSNWN